MSNNIVFENNNKKIKRIHKQIKNQYVKNDKQIILKQNR